MAQFGNSDLKKALSELDSSGNGSEPLLRPEQVERITAIAKESDPEVKGQKTVALMDELIREAKSASTRLEQVLSDFGISPEQAGSFLKSEKLSDDARDEAAKAHAAFEASLQSEIDQAARASRPQGRATSARPAGRLRV